MSPSPCLLFDLDGTLLDTDALHFKAYEVLLAEYDKTITIDTYKNHIMGAQNDVILSLLLPEVPVSRYPGIAEAKERLFRSYLDILEPIAGLTGVLQWADNHDIAIAIVTNAPRANAELMLRGLGLDKAGYPLIIGDELARGKPDPLPYLTGLEALDGDPRHALAFEDSSSGIKSASSAGLKTIGLQTGLSSAALKAAGAAYTIADYDDPQLWAMLEALVLFD